MQNSAYTLGDSGEAETTRWIPQLMMIETTVSRIYDFLHHARSLQKNETPILFRWKYS